MEIREHELWFIYETLKTVECELGALEKQQVWFVSDSRERLDTSLEIVGGLLGVQNDEPDYEIEQAAFEFYEDSEGDEDYFFSLGEYE
jgi:hypothetical protein